MRFFLLILSLFSLLGFSAAHAQETPAFPVGRPDVQAAPAVKSGLDVFLARHTMRLRGKRVGLVTNPTGVDANLNATIDLLNAHPDIQLKALFAPEHGVRGNVRAGENVPGGKDPASGLPVFTLYGGKDHKPTPESLKQIDVLVYDIQDVGSRAYTFIWHLAECMSACAAAGVEVYVLDRPSIYGAAQVDGPVSEKAYLSFIGLYPVPRVYGLTVGELARYLNREHKINCKLTVVAMENYRRGMSFEDTGLPWVPTSPYVPDVAAGLCFAATGALGEVGCVNIGIGYTLPFQVVGATWINGPKMAADLNRYRLPGVKFRTIYYKPIAGGLKDQNVQGVQIHVTDPGAFLPATTEVAILCYLKAEYPAQFKWSQKNYAIFDKAMGTASVREGILAGKPYTEIVRPWQKDLSLFQRRSAPYRLYP